MSLLATNFETVAYDLSSSHKVDEVVDAKMMELNPEALALYNESKTKELITDEDFKTAAEAHTKYLKAVEKLTAEGKIPTAKEILELN